MEQLYNGIELPDVWPPQDRKPDDDSPMPTPWLDDPPAVIPIDVGRQLLVDDFLIAETTLTRTFHHARKFEGNPVLSPETDLEMSEGRQRPASMPFSGGLWFDPADDLFKFWYRAGWWTTEALVTSQDGIHWQRPDLDVVPGTNQVFKPEWGNPDSTTVWIDHETDDPSQRYKMSCFFLQRKNQVLTSPDGIHWSEPLPTGPTGDRSTMFYNPFRHKWVYSIRSGLSGARDRQYWECDNFISGREWSEGQPVYWTRTDRLDPPDPYVGDFAPQLYTLDATPYESLMLGVYMMHLGPENGVCHERHMPKITELNLAYSRDGFHWHRPDRQAFVPASRYDGAWDRAYIQVAGGVCLVVGDELWFYFSGFSGKRPADDVDDMYAGSATGLAILRRDGFASMDASPAGGTLTTRPVTFTGDRLLVNVDCPEGQLRAEVLDEHGSVIAPLTAENCAPLSTDSTCVELKWKGTDPALEALGHKPVRFRFHLTDGKLYAFWTSNTKAGHSDGYVAAGGPGFTGPTDSP